MRTTTYAYMRLYLAVTLAYISFLETLSGYYGNYFFLIGYLTFIFWVVHQFVGNFWAHLVLLVVPQGGRALGGGQSLGIQQGQISSCKAVEQNSDIWSSRQEGLVWEWQQKLNGAMSAFNNEWQMQRWITTQTKGCLKL